MKGKGVPLAPICPGLILKRTKLNVIGKISPEMWDLWEEQIKEGVGLTGFFWVNNEKNTSRGE